MLTYQVSILHGRSGLAHFLERVCRDDRLARMRGEVRRCRVTRTRGEQHSCFIRAFNFGNLLRLPRIDFIRCRFTKFKTRRDQPLGNWQVATGRGNENRTNRLEETKET